MLLEYVSVQQRKTQHLTLSCNSQCEMLQSLAAKSACIIEEFD